MRLLRGVAALGVADVGVTAMGGVVAPSSGGVEARSLPARLLGRLPDEGAEPVLMVRGCPGSSKGAGLLGTVAMQESNMADERCWAGRAFVVSVATDTLYAGSKFSVDVSCGILAYGVKVSELESVVLSPSQGTNEKQVAGEIGRAHV